ncbi:MAG: hypothetical protein KAI40_02530 [Desulfobacterales bacterium]|nr:hypothetical protein [Desulfobacterales bacterium]
MPIYKGNVATGPTEVLKFFNGAKISKGGGRAVFALPSRNRKGISNILTSIKDYPNRFPMFCKRKYVKPGRWCISFYHAFLLIMGSKINHGRRH